MKSLGALMEGKTKILSECLFQCHFIPHNSTRIETVLSRWEAFLYPQEGDYKLTVFRDLISCNLVKSYKPYSATCLPSLLYREEVGSNFLRNGGKPAPFYMSAKLSRKLSQKSFVIAEFFVSKLV